MGYQIVTFNLATQTATINTDGTVITRPMTADEIATETAAEASAAQVANGQQIQTNVLSAQATIQAWIAAHPTGATLTAAQTLVLAKMMNGLCKILLQQFSDTSGT